MNRAFLSLYFFIVISVVLIGWGLDKFWESLTPQNELSAEIIDFIYLAEYQLRVLSPEEQAKFLEKNQQHLQHKIQIISLDDLANSSVSALIFAGKLVPVSGKGGQVSWYKRLAATQQVLVLMPPAMDAKHSIIYSSLLVIFYLGIAVVIFFWIWPLSRDLAKLEKQTSHIGKDGVLLPLTIAPSSTVYPLADSFNKMAQRIRELIGSHREITYAVSHELRTPLARMKFALAMTESLPLSKDQQRNPLNSIRQDITEMEELISSLLLYAGFEQSTGKLDRRDGDMKGLFDEVLARLYRDRPCPLSIEVIDRSTNVVFNCEWKLIETVIQNLLVNAARFAKNKIRIELCASENFFQISIEDDGPGIPEAERERVFDSFVRLYNEGSTQTGGFGLGLSIVRRIIGWHGGKVAFEESELGGAKVVLTWK